MKINIIFDLFLRFSGLGGKFLLLVFISKYLDIAIVGQYGLIVGLVGIMLYFVGMDLYTYTTREIISGQITVWTSLYNQFFFYFVNYFTLFIFWHWIAPISGVNSYEYFVFLLLIVEHLSQETYRLLIILNKITLANMQLFIRSGLWCYVAMIFILNKSINIVGILNFWFLGSLFSFIFSCICIYKIVPPVKNDLILRLDWIKKGVKVAFVFFVGTIMLRSIFYFDRVLISHFSNDIIVGTYVFFMGIANSVQSALDVIVISRYYPRYLEVIHKKDTSAINYYRKKINRLLIYLGAVLFVCSVFACVVVVWLLNKKIYIEMFYIYPLICFAIWLSNMSIVDHYFLYGIKQDIYILKCNLLMLVTFFLIFSLCYFIMSNVLLVVIFSLTSANITLFLSKKNKVMKFFAI